MRSVIANFRASDRSTCVSPKPRRSFRPSEPCSPAGGAVNAAGFNPHPPGQDDPNTEAHCDPRRYSGWPGTKSGRGSAPATVAVTANALNGNPFRATITPSRDQLLVKYSSGPFLAAAGIAYVSAPEKLLRTSKSADA